jgi:beta-glucanase (GH16 family)
LGADGKLPHINIFHFDRKKINIGNAYKNIFDGTKISGINPAKFYIYTLKWSKKELVWMINNVEVHRTTANIPKEEMFLAFNSFIPQKSHGSEGIMEIDWVRVYQN